MKGQNSALSDDRKLGERRWRKRRAAKAPDKLGKKIPYKLSLNLYLGSTLIDY